MKMDTREIVILAMLLAIGVAMGFVESTFPPLVPIPGARLGLSNIVILTVIILFGPKEGILLALLKSTILMLITGSVTSFLYSFTGSAFASISMSIAYEYIQSASPIGISLIGSSFHNVGQILVASFILRTPYLFRYLSLLLLLGIVTGIFVGMGAKQIIKHLKKIGFGGPL